MRAPWWKRLGFNVLVWLLLLGPVANLFTHFTSPLFENPLAYTWAVLLTGAFAWGWYSDRVYERLFNRS